MARREYTEDEQATALAFLAACKGNTSATARKTGIPKSTIHAWKHGRGINSDVSTDVDQKKATLADVLREKAWLLVGAVDQSRIDEANLTQITIALGTVIDKIVILDDVAAERILLEAARDEIKAGASGTGEDPQTAGDTQGDT